MQNSNEPDGPVIRLFEARAKPGCADELAHKFTTVSVDVVRNKPGNLGYFFGPSVDNDPEVFIFASVWRNLAAIKDRFGEEWQSSHLPPGYAALIAECSVRHFDLSSGWNLQHQ